jgi:hypothetical protein
MARASSWSAAASSRGWLAAVTAVEVEPALQLGDPALQTLNQLLQRGVLGQQPLDVRFPRHLRFCPQDRADSPADIGSLTHAGTPSSSEFYKQPGQLRQNFRCPVLSVISATPLFWSE